MERFSSQRLHSFSSSPQEFIDYVHIICEELGILLFFFFLVLIQFEKLGCLIVSADDFHFNRIKSIVHWGDWILFHHQKKKNSIYFSSINNQNKKSNVMSLVAHGNTCVHTLISSEQLLFFAKSAWCKRTLMRKMYAIPFIANHRITWLGLKTIHCNKTKCISFG